MSVIPKEAIKKSVKHDNFKSTYELLDTIKDMFRDSLQEVLEGELGTTLGYDKRLL